jgi:D-alanyl-D-alanine carboxypeptidase
MKKYAYILLFAVLLGCTEETPVFSETKYVCTSSITNTHPESDRFQTFLAEKVSQGLPGISMLIETPEGIWTGGAGVADIPNDIAMQGCNLHKVGSITKTFTGTLILKLYEQGQLDLDDPISDYLSSDIVNRLPNGNQVTIRNLLNHASGIPDHLDLAYSLDYFDNPTRVFTALEDISYIYDQSADFPAGTIVEYSNVNYTLLGLIAEHITDKTGTELYQEMIFDPLGMNTSYFNQNGENPPSLVRGYFDESGTGSFIDITPLKYVAHSMAGGASSTVEDLHTFLQASFTPNVLFSEETINEMLTLSNIPFGEEDFDFGEENNVNKVNGIALCWFQLDTDYGIAYGHNGGFNGRRARMWHFPDSQKTIIFMYNASGESIDSIEDELFRNEMVELLFE